MEPGRELDVLVAEKVMGITWNEARCRICGWPLTKTLEDGCTSGDCSMRPRPAYNADEPAPYSTNIAAAWQVVEHLRNLTIPERGIWLEELSGRYETSYRCGFQWMRPGYGTDYQQALGDTAPHAICLAALRAIEQANS